MQPFYSGNIGSIARAMTNMGFEDLRIVTPKADHLDEQARALAHGANELLEKAQVFPSLQEAVADCSLLVATSHKNNRNSRDCIPVREISSKIAPYCAKNKVAILFGREKYGLYNSEINLCTWIINIPAARPYPSLNLAQAAMLVCYELFTGNLQTASAMPSLTTNHELENFLGYIEKILAKVGFRHKNGRPAVFIGVLRRILTRTGLQNQDLKVLYKLFSQFETKRIDAKNL